MEDIIHYITSHQFTVGVCVFVGILIMFFLLKKLIKLALLFVLLFVAFAGYLYFTEPKKMPANVTETVKRAYKETGKVVEKGRGVYDSGKAIYEKGKKLVTKDEDKILGKDKKSAREE